MMKDMRQPNVAMMKETMGSESAVPTRFPLSKMLAAMARSCLGNHSAAIFALVGYAGASPIPRSRRAPNSDANPFAKAAMAVKKDHQTTATA